MRQIPETQEMLTLSLIAYKGYLRWLGGQEQDDALTARVADALATLDHTKGRHRLVWGPVTFRPTLSLFDDAMMFVVEDVSRPSRYVVVVRGTNPVSPTDWLFGDMWADQSVPWPYGEGAEGARISLSTSVGLSTLQSLTAKVEPHAFGFESMLLFAGVKTLFGPLDAAVAHPLSQLRDKVHGLAERALPAPLVKECDAGLAVLERRNSEAWRTIKGHVKEAIDTGCGAVRFDLYRFLQHRIEERKGASPGLDLANYLRQVTDGGEAEIWVTGHSKGAALASTLALWLADTQGTDLPEAERWDPDRRAVVHCMTFAGPTAGNEAFAAHSDEIIGDRCHRVANELDLVPRGWLFEGLGMIPGLYGDASPVPRPLADLVVSVAHEVRGMGYRQVGKHVSTFSAVQRPDVSFVEQAAHQHLDAYLEWAGLGSSLGAKQFLEL